jgi:hypothetical protein
MKMSAPAWWEKRTKFPALAKPKRGSEQEHATVSCNIVDGWFRARQKNTGLMKGIGDHCRFMM